MFQRAAAEARRERKGRIPCADCIIKSAAGEVQVMKDGFGADFSEELAKKVLTEHDITVIVRFYQGDGEAKAWGCDLTYDYVKINGDYRT